MAMGLLGADTAGVIDIHSGGEDNIFPHHECEIAQTRCATGETHFARYWFHTRHLIVESKKMSKSKGNFFTLSDLLAKGVSPAAVRLELTRTHYRDNANFTFQGLKDVQRMIDRWTRLEAHLSNPAVGDREVLAGAIKPFTEALCDDLQIARSLGVLNKAVGAYALEGDAVPPGDGGGQPTNPEHAALRTMLRALGVRDLQRSGSQTKSADEVSVIETKIAERNQARADKDWKSSDRIRDELLAMDIALHDGPEGTKWSKVIK